MPPLESLHRLSLTLGASLDRARECAVFLDWMKAETRPRLAALFVAGPDRDSLRLIALSKRKKLPAAPLPLGFDPWDWLEAQKISLPRGERCALPIVLEGELFGLLAVVSAQKGEALNKEQRLLDLALAYLAPILRNIEKHESVERLVEERTAQLRESEERYRTYIEQASDYIFALDAQGRITFVNEAMCLALGYRRPAELLGQPALTVVAPQARQEAAQVLQRIWNGETVDYMDLPVQTRDGKTLTVQIRGRAFYRNGKLVETLHIARDITLQKQAEEAIKNSERRLIALIENGLDYISLLDAEGNLLWESPSSTSLLGYEYNAFLGRSILDLVHPEDQEWIRPQFSRLAAEPGSRQSSIFRLRRINGSWCWVEAVAANLLNDPAVGGIVVNYRDISGRIQAEQAIRAAEKKYRAIFEGAVEGIFQSTPEGRFLTVNPALARMWGYDSPEELLVAIHDIARQVYVNPADREEFKRQVEEHGEVRGFEYRVRRKDGSVMWVSENARAVRDENGALLYYEGNIQDITESRRRERELEAEAMLVQALNESSELQPLLGRLLEAARHAIPAAEKGGILLMEADGRLRIRALNGYHDPRLREFAFASDLGYSARAARERQPLLIADARADDSIRYDGEIEEARNIHSAIAAPLLIQDRVIGVLSLDSTRREAFSEDDLRLLTNFAATAALVIERARLFEETRRRLYELETLQSVSRALRQARTVQEMLPIFVQHAAQAVNANAGSIFLLEESSGDWVSQGWLDAGGKWLTVPARMRHGQSEGVTGYVGASGEIYLTEDWRTDPLTQPLPGEMELLERLTSGISLPLRAEERVIGVMHIWREQFHAFTEDEKRVLTAISDMAGNSLQRARLYEETARRVEQLQSLQAIDRAITANLDLRVSLDILLEHTRRHLQADAAGVLLFDPSFQTLKYAAGRGFQSRVYQNANLRIGEGEAGRAALERRTVIVPNLALSSFLRMDMAKEENFVSYMAAPLVAKGQIKGVLEIFHRSPFTPNAEQVGFFETLARQAAIAVDNGQLFENLQRANVKLSIAYDAAIEGWSRALDLRDRETEGHSQRVTELTLELARAMGLGGEELAHMRRGALLHDIGKVGVPDHILHKEGPLTEEEWDLMRQHPRFAHEMLLPIEYLRSALDIPYCHHEKWDGTGYPRGLKGEQIPLAARIFAVVDVYDALTSDRPYRKAWTKAQALKYIREQAGKHFDPAVVEAFLALIEKEEKFLSMASGRPTKVK